MVMVMLLFLFLLGQRIYPSEREKVTEESITYTGTFFWEKADGTEEEIRIPGKYDVPAGELLVIRSVLPEDYNENTIAIRASIENVRIFIGGELRTVYDTKDTRPFGKNSASRYVFCETSGGGMPDRNCGLSCSPLAKNIPVLSIQYIAEINQISGDICSIAILW